MKLECAMKHLISIMSSVAPGLEWSHYTTHSAKTTLLAWSKQLDLAGHWRAAQGHHRLPGANGGCVAEYGREDVEDALRCQQALLLQLDSGWVPRRAQIRGAGVPLAEPEIVLPEVRLSADMFRNGGVTASHFQPHLPSDIWMLMVAPNSQSGQKRRHVDKPSPLKMPKLDREIWRSARGLF